MSISYEFMRNIDWIKIEWFKYMTPGDVGTKIIVGFTVVFIGLVLLVLFFSILGLIFKAASNASAKKENNKKAKSLKGSDKKALPAATKKPEATVSSPVPAVEDGISDEVVAVIAAAVAAMSDGETRYSVRSIKKSHNAGGRPVWAMAGIRDNTSPV